MYVGVDFIFIEYVMCSWETWCDQTPVRKEGNLPLEVNKDSFEEKKYKRMNEMAEQRRKDMIAWLNSKWNDGNVYTDGDFFIGR